MTAKRLTPAMRARKIDAARTRLIAAQADLASVADDFAMDSFLLKPAERSQWEDVVHALTSLDKAVEQLGVV